MILKIELKEQISNIYTWNLDINLVNKDVTYIKGDSIIKKSTCNLSEKEASEFLNSYITYWEKEYIDPSISDGRMIELSIFTDKEVSTYRFINSFPDDLDNFIKALKTKVDIAD